MKQNSEIKLEQIAKEILNIPTLDTRKSDGLDFHEVSVWSLKKALIEAYKQGVKDLNDLY